MHEKRIGNSYENDKPFILKYFIDDYINLTYLCRLVIIMYFNYYSCIRFILVIQIKTKTILTKNVQKVIPPNFMSFLFAFESR